MKKFIELKSVKEVEPEESACIIVDSPSHLYTLANGLVTHNSVAQRNIINACILRPKDWVLMGIDLKRVELSMYRQFGVDVATDLEPAAKFLEFAQATMMKRYEKMEEYGTNDYDDLPDEEKGPALLLMIDELGELLSAPKGKSLVSSTFIPNKNNRKNLGEIQVGDIIYDKWNKETEVEEKINPGKKETYEMIFKSDNKETRVVAACDHEWVFKEIGRVETEEIANRKDLLGKITIYSPIEKTDFILEKIEKVENEEDLFCIRVKSPSHEFLCTKEGIPTHNSDEIKRQQELKDTITMYLSSIARLGRAARVHLVLATQRPSADMIDGQIRDNLGVRLCCGAVPSGISTMMFGTQDGARIPSSPQGRIGLQISGGEVELGQGFFAPGDWTKEYFDSLGGFDTTTLRAVENQEAMNEEVSKMERGSTGRAEDDWDEDMEDLWSLEDEE